ncbi:hypothetical protein PoB_000573200 [Plakobranchus ocellatus]|uniref:Uncharacterized protein n=1 Tax=Plakobranchus ocellatus TaxID=259542 RepID=A0AAV3Y9V7_9GAST|nr:hypothetical protein PoB_000573200 [Plakobranchus ocellatus]
MFLLRGSGMASFRAHAIFPLKSAWKLSLPRLPGMSPLRVPENGLHQGWLECPQLQSLKIVSIKGRWNFLTLESLGNCLHQGSLECPHLEYLEIVSTKYPWSVPI